MCFNNLFYLLKDQFIFIIFEACLITITFYALFEDIKNRDSGMTIGRGNQSWAYFYATFGIISVIISGFFSATEIKEIINYKGIIFLLNIGITLYLCFYNGWSTNKIVGFVTSIKNKKF